jgi:membrane-associated protease RseP (regulator of RpoE activity)
MSPDELDSQDPLPELHLTRRRIPPLLLFIATCISTFLMYAIISGAETIPQAIQQGFLYAVPLMTILVCHEMGHFIQTHRQGVFSSWPWFLPIPLPPIGTMGAVIFMEPRMGHRRALFDIGITGPLAGLVPAIIFCIIGIRLHNNLTPVVEINKPLLFEWLYYIFGSSGIPLENVRLHPIAYAGWVGFLITSVNLFPIGQLDGGPVLYALMKKKAKYVSTFLLVAALGAVLKFKIEGWSLMLILLIVLGPQHPPTADDEEPLGLFRYILGWLTLAFVIIGFTPQPFNMKNLM